MRKVILVLLLLNASLAYTFDVLTIDKDTQQLNLKNFCYHFKDSTNNLKVSDILNIDWEKLEMNPIFAFNKSVHWLRYEINNPYNYEIERVLYFPYNPIHEIDVFTVHDSVVETICKLGTKRPYSDKQYKSTGYPILIKFKPQQKLIVLVCLKHLYRPLRATTYLLTNKQTTKIIQQDEKLIWFWRGIFFFALIGSFVLYWYLKQKLFLYYFLLNLGVGLFIASQMGDYFLFFNIDKTDIIVSIDFAGTILINLFLPLFLNALVPVKKRNKFIWKWMYRLIYLMFVFYVLTLFPALRETVVLYYSHLYLMIVSTLVFILQPILLIKSIANKDKYARSLFVIYSIYVFAAFFDVIIPNLGFLSDSPHVNNNVMLASIFEIFSFMLVMGKESVDVYKERQSLLLKQQLHQKEMIISMVKGQEEERNRVGRELHDLIGANMAIIKQQIGKENDGLYRIVSQTIESVRNLSHGMITPMVDKEEFVDEIKELCFLFSTNKLKVHSFFHRWPQIDNQEITTHLYRVVQELLQNAFKHSGASNVYFQFIGEDEKQLSIIYEDDGIGFDSLNVKGKGLGLRNIESRVVLLNGVLQIDSSENGKGCTIVIELNLQNS